MGPFFSSGVWSSAATASGSCFDMVSGDGTLVDLDSKGRETHEPVKLFHRTPAAETILRQGFRDAAGYYVTDRLQEGVWLSTVPPDANDGAQGTDLLEVDIPEEDVAPMNGLRQGIRIESSWSRQPS